MITVITPCKNVISEGRETFFRRMMQTLREQTYQNFEHILIDGGSQDGTVALCEEYVASGHITTFISVADNNLHEALNRGLALARGEFIHVMNTDNYFATPYFFERSLAALQDEKIDFTHADRIIVHRGGGRNTLKRGNEHAAYFRMPFRYQTMLLRKSLYDEFGPLDEKYKIASDFKFMLQLLRAGKRGKYFREPFIVSLDGGITTDRDSCTAEVSQVIYECYGKEFGLSREICNAIYRKLITPELMKHLEKAVTDKGILDSLRYCFERENALTPPNCEEGLYQANLPALGEAEHGKVRDNWDLLDGTRLMVTTDRHAVNGHLVCTVPGKGALANATSEFWFSRTYDIIPNHFIKAIHPNVWIVRQAKRTIPVEVVVRQYLARTTSNTSLFYNYARGRRTIYGIYFPDGLKENQELPMGPVVTPTTKDPSGVDAELTNAQAQQLVDSEFGEGSWYSISNTALQLFARAQSICRQHGLILMDTKFEFGVDSSGRLMLIDELLTSECSRYADLAGNLIDKDVVGAYIKSNSTAEIPKEVIERQIAAYRVACDQLGISVPETSTSILDALSRYFDGS